MAKLKASGIDLNKKLSASDIAKLVEGVDSTVETESSSQAYETASEIADYFSAIIASAAVPAAIKQAIEKSINVYATNITMGDMKSRTMLAFFTNYNLYSERAEGRRIFRTPKYPSRDLTLYGRKGVEGVELEAFSDDPIFPLRLGKIKVSTLKGTIDQKELQRNEEELYKIIQRMRYMIQAIYRMKPHFLVFKYLYYYAGLNINEIINSIMGNGDPSRFITKRIVPSRGKKVAGEGDIVLKETVTVELSFNTNALLAINSEDLKRLYTRRTDALAIRIGRKLPTVEKLLPEIYRAGNIPDSAKPLDKS